MNEIKDFEFVDKEFYENIKNVLQEARKRI